MMEQDVKALTRLERQWLRRRYCGWCAISCLAPRCGAMYAKDSERCNMDEQRAIWLQSYKPRAAIKRLRADGRLTDA